MRTLLAASATLLLATTASAGFWDCSNKEPRNASLAAGGVSRVVVIARAGTLKVTGGGGGEVRATGTACADDADILKEMKLTATRRGSEIRVEAIVPEANISFWGTKTATLDFEVVLPAGVAVEVQDTSGAAEIANVGPLTVDDGSGELRIQGVRGNLSVRDTSGAIEIHDVTGDIRIEDGSGGIDVEQVGGDVVIADDGSGEIDIRNVRHNVNIEDDGSGGVSVTEVGGDFTVGRKGSGGVSYDHVAGRVSVPRRY
ncbi:MAG TPA: hypothetical protein VGR02_05625 [Thermoanaerobaculia bacterium]|jgi:hypothetical protein|nr:hypothetical protein [Thermoanaerobaculia bacterium]